MTLKLVSFKLCPYVQRAVITLEEKDVGYELEYIDLDDPPAWFKRCSPFGQVPLLQIGDEVLFESAVILDYLDEVYPPRFHPENPLIRAQHKAWIEFGSALLRQQHAVGVAADEELFIEALAELKRLMARLKSPLEQGLFGDDGGFSLVDAAYTPFFMRMEILATVRSEVTADTPPAVARWANRLLARPSLRRSVVVDFDSLYFQFLRRKGSWLSSQRRAP
ncbi:MAG: glutathione S-transferase family protein [Candidatus Thiodiazotropha sp.]